MAFNKTLLLACILLLCTSTAYSQATYQTFQSGQWNQNSTWTYVSGTPVGSQPLATDNVIINHNITVTVNTSVNNITVNGGNSVTINANNLTLTVNGTMTMNGTSVIVGGNTNRTLSLQGDFIVPASQNPSFLQVTVTQALARNFTVNGTFGSTTAGYSVSLGNVNIGSTGTWQPTATVIVSANTLNITDGSILDGFNITGGFNVGGTFTVNYGSAGAVSTLGDCILTVGGATFINGTLNISKTASGTKTFNGTITNYIHGEFRNLVGESLVLNCSIINNSLWAAPAANTGTYTINTAGNYTYTGTNVIGMNQLSITAAATLTNLGSLSLINAAAAGLVVNNASGSFINGNGGYLQILSPGTGVTLTSGTINFSTSTNEVDYAYAGAQNVYATTYDKLTTSTSGTKSLVGATVVNNILKTSSSALLDIKTNTLNGTGSITMTGTSQISISKTGVNLPELTGTSNSFASGTTIRLYGTAAQTLKSSATFPYQNILINGTAGCSANMSNVASIGGNLTISSAAVMTGNPVMTVAGTTTYSSTGSTTLANNLTTGSFLISSGTLNYSGLTITVNGNSGSWTTNGGTLTTNVTSTVVLTTGTSQQIGGTSAPSFANLTVNNSNDITLTASTTATSSLSLAAGRIITGSNTMITAASAIVSRTSGFVDGNFKKNVNTCGPCSLTFEIGNGTVYAPLQLTSLTISTGGSLTASTTATDDPNITASLINSSKSVNRYWTLANTGANITYNPQFTYDATDVDGAATPANFNYAILDPAALTWTNPAAPSGTPTSTNFTALAAIAVPAAGNTRHFQIGESGSIPITVINRLTGTQNWSAAATWIQSRTGSIVTNVASTAVTGTGTLFLTELAVNDVIMLQAAPATIIGTVASIASNTSLTLTAVAGSSTVPAGATFGREHVPISTDAVVIGNPNNVATTNIQLDVSASVNSITFTALNSAHSLTHLTTNSLTVSSSVTINHPTAAVTNVWNINGGSASCTALVIGSATATNTRIAQVALTSGSLSATNITFSTANSNGFEVTTVLDNSGTGQINMTGSFNFTNSRGTLKAPVAAGASTFNFNGSTSTQAILVPSSNTTAAWVYSTILCNNPSGTTLLSTTNPASAALSNTNFTGDLKIQAGTLTSNLAITGGGTRTFQIAPGATFLVNGGAVGLTGFGTFDFGTTAPFGTFNYSVSNGTTPLVHPYGNLILGNGQFYTMTNAATTIAGSLTITGSATMAGTATPASTITVSRDVTVNSGAAISDGNISSISVGGNWTNNGTFSLNNSSVTFTGAGVSQPQIISGSGADSFTNLILNTAASTNTVQLQKSIAVGSVLTLTQGGLDLNGNTLNVTNQSTSAITRTSGYIKSETQTSAYAPVAWTINGQTGSFLFPFGKSSTEYIPFTFNITSGANFGTILSAATYGTIANNTPYPSGVTDINAKGVDNSANVVDRFWIISTSATTTIPTATMTFTATTSEVGTVTSLVAQQWSSGNFWNPAFPGQSNTSVSATVPGINSFGIWTLANSNFPLPIELVNFNATLMNSWVKLTWSTLSELNNDHFVIERTKDGVDFETVSLIKGNGTSSQTHNYQSIDFSPFQGKSYYRLNQVDFDGHNHYSELIEITVNRTSYDITPVPNPVVDKSTIFIPSDFNDGDIIVEIYSLQGSLISSKHLSGASSVELLRSEMPTGVYLVRISSGSQVASAKFIVLD